MSTGTQDPTKAKPQGSKKAKPQGSKKAKPQGSKKANTQAPAEANTQVPAEADLQELHVPDDASVVYDEEGDSEEDKKAIEKIAKILEPDTSTGEGAKAPAEEVAGQEARAEEAGEEMTEPPAEEAATQKPEELSQAIKDRATQAGLDEALTERLYQSGLLEETLAASHRRITDAISLDDDIGTPKAVEPKGDPPQVVPKEVPPESIPVSGGGELEPLDPDLHGEELSKREVFLRSQISELKEQVGNLSRVALSFHDERVSQFDGWFDGQVNSLGQKELFGEGGQELLPADSVGKTNREKLRVRYIKSCKAVGVDPLARHKDSFDLAFPAEFKDEIFKAGQRQTVGFIRDKAGKFLSAAPMSGGTPLPKKEVSGEQAYEEDLEKVKGILSR